MDIFNPASPNYGLTEDEYWNTKKELQSQQHWDTNVNTRDVEPMFVGLFNDVLEEIRQYRMK